MYTEGSVIHVAALSQPGVLRVTFSDKTSEDFPLLGYATVVTWEGVDDEDGEHKAETHVQPLIHHEGLCTWDQFRLDCEGYPSYEVIL